MKKAVLVVVALFCALVLSTSCSKGDNTLRLVTYNVGAFHKAGYTTEHMCVEILKSLEPDAISLNELDSCNTRGGIYTDQLSQVSAALGKWPCVFGKAIAYKGGSYGIGVLTKPCYNVVSSWTAQLPKADGKEVRALAVIETEKFVYCSTHLDLTDSSQLAQVEAIDSLVAARYDGIAKPVFLCGDMNAEPGSATIGRLKEKWEMLNSVDYSFSTNKPRKCIDYIFAYKNAAKVKVLKKKVCTSFKSKDINAVIASDHFPQFVEIEIIK